MALVQRQIQVSFSLGQGNFQGGGNQATVSANSSTTVNPNLPRVSARVFGLGGESGINLSMSIWGMRLSSMNQLSTVGRQIHYIGQNSVTVMAGDAISGMSLVFSGIITSAFVDAQAQPQVSFRVEAVPDGRIRVQNTAPNSVQGQADVAQLMGQLAQQAGLQFENNGVSVKLRNPYLWGSLGNQIKMLARYARIEHIIDRGKLSIWAPGQSRSGNAIILSPKSGLAGYPLFNQANVIARSIFNPNIVNGGQITIQSSLTPASGTWTVINVSHELDANMPRGKWFTIVEAYPAGQPGEVASD